MDRGEMPSPRVAISMAQGRIIAEILVKQAPTTARNFLNYVDSGLYGAATFYRALRPDNGTRLPGLRLIQGGIDPTCRHPPLPTISHEPTSRTGLHHSHGALSMARWDAGSASSEFFVVIGDAPQLDAGGPYGEGYAVFGRVVEGMALVEKISVGPTGERPPIDYLMDAALVDPVPMNIERSIKKHEQ